MRVLLLTWEYPPRIVGGISRAAEGLGRALAAAGEEVHVVTNEFPQAPAEENMNGVHVHRVPIQVAAPDFHTWIMIMNHFFTKAVGDLTRRTGRFQIIHYHDWLTAPSGIELKHTLGSIAVVTLHSLEFRRVGGVTSPQSRMIDAYEWWSTYEAPVVIVCSGFMKRDVVNHFQVPEEKVWVIPNGVDLQRYEQGADPQSVRGRYGLGDGQKLLLFLGRLTHQKGCEYLIRALPDVSTDTDVRVLIVGDGYLRGELEKEAMSTGHGWRVKFTGFLPDSEVVQLLRAADALVVPSVYEPFGVVALEGMAAGVPVVASNTDGLAEVVQHDYTGCLVYPRDPKSIAWGLRRVLTDAPYAHRISENARRVVQERFSWPAIAHLTLDAYRAAGA